MNHLSALDALFLQLESPQTPMHVGGLILLQKPAKHRGSFLRDFRQHIEARLHLAPLFTRKLMFMPLNLANPVWLHDDDVDLDYHIRSLTLPKPGTQSQLETCIAKLHTTLLDRDRPLWEFYVIEGLKSGEVAFYCKMHHAALDGQGGVALAQALLDTDPVPRIVLPADQPAHGGMKLSAAKMLSAAFRNTVAQYSRIARALPGAVRVAGAIGAAALAKRAAAKSSAREAGNVDSGASVNLKALIPKGALLGPRTAWNVALRAPRVFVTLRLPLDEVKRIAKQFDAKLNDVVLAICSGALRRYLAAHGGIPDKPLIGAVPASLRAPGDTSQNNQVTMMLVSLATNKADALQRLKLIGAASTKAKSLTGGMKSVIPTDLPSLGVPWLMSLFTSLYNNPAVANRIPVLANLVISNVPGPQVALYLAGAKMMSYYPVSIAAHGLGLNITVQSYNGGLDIGIIACKNAVPDLRLVAQFLEEAHEELLLATTSKSVVTANIKKRPPANQARNAKKRPASVKGKPGIKKPANVSATTRKP